MLLSIDKFKSNLKGGPPMSSPQAPKENKMGVMPVNKLLLSMSIPMMLSMLVQALYNVVDSVFVSRISEDALNAVSLAFPIQNLMIAVSVGTGVGINAQLSRYLGSKNQKHADATAVNGLFVSIISLLDDLDGIPLSFAFSLPTIGPAFAIAFFSTIALIVLAVALVLWFRLYGRNRRYGKSNKNYRQHAYRGRRR